MVMRDIQLKDVENFMGIQAKDFVSVNANKIHPSFDAFDKLRLVPTTAFALHFGEPDCQRRLQDSTEKFFRRLEYKPVDKKRADKRPVMLIDDNYDHQEEEEEEEEENLGGKKRVGKRSKLNDDWDYQKEKRSNNAKKRVTKKRIRVSSRCDDQQAPTILHPDQLKKVIEETGADSEPVLVISKVLTTTDLMSNENRLLIPAKQSKKFLEEEEEKELLKKQANGMKRFMDVRIRAMPSLEERMIKVTNWDMAKKGGKVSKNYGLNGPNWKRLMKEEGLKEKMLVQLWAYRVNQELRLVLIS